MAPINVFENGLNVQYVPNFIAKEEADSYLKVLRTLPYYCPTFKIRGKSVKPKRLVLAYGDENLSYAFSGTSIDAEPWTPLMLELRDCVEKFTACTFNYVLLNLYVDGSSYISQHKDDESGLDATFPIAVLSFGAERTIEFKKAHTPSTFIKLGHGSLYTMSKPTNKLFTHGIAPDSTVKDARISLTFRHLLPNSSSTKKPKLQISFPVRDSSSTSDSSSPTRDTPSTSDSSSPTRDTPVCDNSSKSDNPVCDNSSKTDNPVCDTSSTSENSNRKEKNCHPLIAEWDLNWNTFFQIIVDSNCNIRLHIRVFKESQNGELFPTRNGVMFTLLTWCDFITKLPHLKFRSTNESFICNNQLMVLCVDPTFCILQQIYPLNTVGFYLKPTVFKLFSDQVLKMRELIYEITETIISTLFTIQLPKLILKSTCECFLHMTKECARQNFLDCIMSEIIEQTKNTIQCDPCENMPEDQNLHICTKPLSEHYVMNRLEILLSLDMNKIVKNIIITCNCAYNNEFFKEFDTHFFDNYIMEELAKIKL